MPNTYTSAKPMSRAEYRTINGLGGLGDILGKILIYKSTPVRNPLNGQIVTTLNPGVAFDVLEIPVIGYALIMYATLKFGLVKVSDVILEADTQRMVIRAKVSSEVRSGPGKDFALVMAIPAKSEAVALQFANNWYRISSRQWVIASDFEATNTPDPGKPKPNAAFPWKPVLIAGGAIALLGTGIGAFKIGRRRTRR